MKKRQSLLLLIVGICLTVVYLIARGFDLVSWEWTALCAGLGGGLFGAGFSGLVNAHLYRQYPELAREKRIQEEDERNVSLKNQAKAKGYDLMTYLFGGLLLVMAIFRVSLWVVLLGVGVYLAVQGYALYWRFRLDREQ